MTAPVHPSSLVDQDLVALSLQGDRQAFGELVCRHRESVVAVVYRMIGDVQMAEEAAQEAFLRAWQRLQQYKPQYSFRNWIITIAVHQCLDQLRREPIQVDVDSLSLEASAGRPEAELDDREQIEQVRRAVLALPPASRAVLVLREYEGQTYQEISQALGIPLGTVMSRLNYARTQLRQALSAYWEEP